MPRRSLRIANCEKRGLQKYKHTPLENVDEWIRLLYFLPKTPGASFRAFILHVKLCDAPPYRALSYTWGASGDVHAEIELCIGLDLPMMTSFLGQIPGVYELGNECSRESYLQIQRFPVRPGLEAAMKRLESMYGNQYLWIDAICIDQSNDAEKGHQVSIMNHIYRRAVEIDIWLGEEEDESDLAMDLIEEYEKTCGCKAEFEFAINNFDAQLAAFKSKTRNWTFHWRALGELMSRPWFTRRWTIQETAFAQQKKYILCGSKRVCWFEFGCVVQILHDRNCNDYSNDALHRDLELIYSLHWVSEKVRLGEEHHLTLDALLGKFHRSSCADPRDAVYSLISLARDINPKEWLPDYSIQNNELMVFKKVFQHIVYTSRSLDVMCRSDKTPWEIITWLPKFGQAFKCGCKRTFCVGRGNRDTSFTTFGVILCEFPPRVYSASGSTIPKIRFSINGLILYVDGYRVDTIKSVSARDESRCRSCDTKIYPDQWMRTACDMNMESCGVEKIPEAYLRSLVGNRALRGRREIVETLPDEWLSVLEEAACFHDTCGCDVNEEAKDVISTMQTFRKALRKVFATTERSLGFVDSLAKEGDTVCILLGCSVPVVLRSIDDSAFAFVGECYIHGLMEGEFMHTASENAWEPEEIEIH